MRVRARTPVRQPFHHPTDDDPSVGAPGREAAVPSAQLFSGQTLHIGRLRQRSFRMTNACCGSTGRRGETASVKIL